jgi:hypothetical protein
MEEPRVNTDRRGWRCVGVSALLYARVVAILALSAVSAPATDSLCATVKIEIVQELTLERQAFDARMRISNGLDTLPLQDVSVDVRFADDDDNPVLATSDPNGTNALFFIRVDSLDGISDVAGTGSVAPSSAAEIHWLIIPAAGAAGNLPQGKRYQVGATIRYLLGGEQKEVEVVQPEAPGVAPLQVIERTWEGPSIQADSRLGAAVSAAELSP